MTPFWMAWQMFLWIPCPKMVWDENKKKEMLLCIPLVGLLIGAMWYLLYFLADLIPGNTPFLSAFLAVFPWLVTGFMHIDGYLDCSDAALYFGSKEKKLQILKDSHTGSFAVISAAVLSVLQFAAMLQLRESAVTRVQALFLILIPVIARSVSSFCVCKYEALPTSSYKGLSAGTGKVHLIVPFVYIAVCAVIACLVMGPEFLIAILVEALIEFLIIKYLIKNFGGMSGDISGAAICTGELVGLITLAFAAQFI